MESQAERQIQRAALPFAIESAGVDDESRFRVSGIMSTFKVMRSRRILHPRGFKNWLKRTRGKAALPMLADHGVNVGGFASIGLWDRFDFIEGRGMRWSGWVGEGTPLADQARTLLGQKILHQLSIGWLSLQQRFIRKDDSDLDEHAAHVRDLSVADQEAHQIGRAVQRRNSSASARAARSVG